jgi:hypothetical protein
MQMFRCGHHETCTLPCCECTVGTQRRTSPPYTRPTRVLFVAFYFKSSISHEKYCCQQVRQAEDEPPTFCAADFAYRNHMYERLQTRWSEWYRLAPTAFHREFSCTGDPAGTGDAPSIGLLWFQLVHRHPLATRICSQKSLLVVPKVCPGVFASLYQSRGVVVQREGGKERQAGPAHR